MFIALARSIWKSNRGVALIEFAFGLPVLLILGLGGLEIANIVLAHLTASRIASLTADNASRIRDSIDEADVLDLMQAAQMSSGTLDLKTNGRLIISALQVNDKGNGQWIRWQRCYGTLAGSSAYATEDAGKSDATLLGMGPPSRRIAADDGTTIMFVELTLRYKSIVPKSWAQPATIRYESAFNVRKRPNAYLTNTSNLSTNSTARC